MTVRLEFWNKWVPVRREDLADGTTCWYFGIGRLSVQRRPTISDQENDDERYVKR